jgi:hypothetical protein
MVKKTAVALKPAQVHKYEPEKLVKTCLNFGVNSLTKSTVWQNQ